MHFMSDVQGYPDTDITNKTSWEREALGLESATVSKIDQEYTTELFNYMPIEYIISTAKTIVTFTVCWIYLIISLYKT